jgi:multicomponent Na+:H+ antiporter subunit D
MLSALVFFLFLPLLKRTETISIDTDWLYRKGGRLFYHAMDRVFNGLNSISDRIFAVALAGYIGRVSKEGPVRTALLFLAPVWVLVGTKGEKLAQKRLNVQKAIETGTSPIGISAAVATIFLIVMFLLM